jgi:hypothetical protein
MSIHGLKYRKICEILVHGLYILQQSSLLFNGLLSEYLLHVYSRCKLEWLPSSKQQCYFSFSLVKADCLQDRNVTQTIPVIFSLPVRVTDVSLVLSLPEARLFYPSSCMNLSSIHLSNSKNAVFIRICFCCFQLNIIYYVLGIGYV